jgi:pimeloyl-ACP methyl ester carboxylesterase
VDLPGFGGSVRRANLLAWRAMGELLARLVEETGPAGRSSSRPDIGIPAALLAAADHPELFAGVVVGAGAQRSQSSWAILTP